MHQHVHNDTVGFPWFSHFSDMWNPGIFLLTLLLAASYLILIGPQRKRFSEATPVSMKKKVLFMLGLSFLYIAQGSPLSYYGHHNLFSAHMVQQSLVYMVMPPLLLLGTPEWLLQSLFRNHIAKKALGFFTNPIVGALSFNLLFSFYHIPLIFDYAAEHHMIMTLYHLVLIFAAFQMWWPIVSPMSDQSQLSDLRKMAYIFANSVLITPACALIIFADTLLYTAYSTIPDLITGHTALHDQRLGGVLMKLIQEGVYGSALAYIFFTWYAKEKGTDATLDTQNSSFEMIPTPTTDNRSRA